MKNNSPSPRFLYEFDTVDTLALRNMSEKRKLQQQLGELDKQLHSNLVRIESDILSIRLENFETSPNLQRNPKFNESGRNINIAKPKTKLSEISQKDAKSYSEMLDTNSAYFNDSINGDQAMPKLSPHRILPKITTTSYLTTKQEQLEKKDGSEVELMDESSSLETISEMGEKKMQAEQRILMSLQRPRSKPLQTSRPPTPQATNQFLSPIKPIDKERRASSHGLLAPLPSEYVTKGRLFRAFSAPDVSESLSSSEIGCLGTLPKRENGANGAKGLGNGITVCVTSENSSPVPERKAKLKRDAVKTHKVSPESKTSNFDQVLERRLKLAQDGVPEREDLERIRYLRLKDENANNEVEDIFAVLHQNNSD